MDSLPQDPYILLSVVNTKLRDTYTSPEELCDDLGVDLADLTDRLHAAGFDYDATTNSYR